MRDHRGATAAYFSDLASQAAMPPLPRDIFDLIASFTEPVLKVGDAIDFVDADLNWRRAYVSGMHCYPRGHTDETGPANSGHQSRHPTAVVMAPTAARAVTALGLVPPTAAPHILLTVHPETWRGWPLPLDESIWSHSPRILPPGERVPELDQRALVPYLLRRDGLPPATAVLQSLRPPSSNRPHLAPTSFVYTELVDRVTAVLARQENLERISLSL